MKKLNHKVGGKATLLAPLCAFMLSLSNIQGQTTFQMAYGGSQNDEGRSALKSGTNYIVSGSTNSFGAGNVDYYLIAIDSCGSPIISRTVGGTAADWNYDLLKNFAGRYVLYGKTASYGVADNDTYLIELNASAASIKTGWVVGDSLRDEGQAITEAKDTSGYVGVGYTNSYGAGNYDVYVIKYRYNGTIAWTKVIGGNLLDKGYDIQTVSDGGYIITGETKSFGAGGSDVYLIKLNAAGNILWTSTYGTNGDDIGYSVKQTLDGGYIITGYTEIGDTIPFGKNVYLIKTDPSGNKIWSYAYGGNNNEEGHSVIQLTDSSYAICGFTNSYGNGNDDDYLLKVTANGTLTWAHTYGADSIDRCFCLLKANDNGYLLTGQTYSFGAGKSDVYLVKTDPNGYSYCNEDTGGVRYTFVDYDDYGADSSSGGILNQGGILNSPTSKIDTICNSCLEERLDNTILGLQSTLLTIYPIPANNYIEVMISNAKSEHFEVQIVDIMGRQVKSLSIPNAKFYLDISDLSSGMYSLIVKDGQQMLSEQFIKQ